MTPEQQAAYVIGQSVCALIEALGMQANNLDPNRQPYTKMEFDQLIEKYGIHHNAVISLFREG